MARNRNAMADTSEIRDFAKRVQKVPASVRQAGNVQIDKSVKRFIQTLKRNVPVSEHAPHIKDSIQIIEGNAEMHERQVTIGTDALKYAVPLEFGHRNRDGSHTPAEAFFVPTTKVVMKYHRAAMRRVVRKALKALWPQA